MVIKLDAGIIFLGYQPPALTKICMMYALFLIPNLLVVRIFSFMFSAML